MILFRQKSVGTESNDFCKDKYYSPNYRKQLLDYCYFPIIFTADIGNWHAFFVIEVLRIGRPSLEGLEFGNPIAVMVYGIPSRDMTGRAMSIIYGLAPILLVVALIRVTVRFSPSLLK